MKKKQNLLVFLSTDWEKFHRSDSLLPFAEYFNLILIQRPVDFFITPFVNPKRLIKFLKNPKINKTAENLTILTPFILIHDNIFLYIPLFQKINNILLRYQINKLIKDEGSIVLVYHPIQYGSLESVKSKFIIYECYDQYDAFSTINSRKRNKINNYEIKLVQKANIIIATSKNLFEIKNKNNNKTYFFPNGVNFDFFSSIKNVRSVITTIGFLGTFHEGVDIELLYYLANYNNNWRFLFISPYPSKTSLAQNDRLVFSKLIKLKNVTFTGWIPQYDKNNFSKHCSAINVGIIPFKTTVLLNKYVLPNKLFEYLSMGRPVVSTDIPEVKPFDKFIKIAKDYPQFKHHIQDSLFNNDENIIRDGKFIASQYSWEKRARKIFDVINL